MKLSHRLKTVYDYIPQDSVLVDIGTDHGLLIVYALEQKKVSQAYALDIAKQPLDAARRNLEQFGFQNQVSLQLRNGLIGFTDDANCYVMAGMGAETIWGIIDAYEFDKDDSIIVQSNTKLPWLRETVLKNGFQITEETFFVEKKIPTFIMVLKYTKNILDYDETDVWVGPVLKNAENDAYKAYLKQRLEHIQKFEAVNPTHKAEIKALQNYL